MAASERSLSCLNFITNKTTQSADIHVAYGTVYIHQDNIALKILANILLNRLNVHLDQTELIPVNQCGFRKDRGT